MGLGEEVGWDVGLGESMGVKKGEVEGGMWEWVEWDSDGWEIGGEVGWGWGGRDYEKG